MPLEKTRIQNIVIVQEAYFLPPFNQIFCLYDKAKTNLAAKQKLQPDFKDAVFMNELWLLFYWIFNIFCWWGVKM